MFVPTRAVIVAAIALLALPLVGGPARAADGDGDQSVAALRAQADAIAGRYFDSLARYQSLDREIAGNQRVVTALAARARKARTDARDRAVSAYRTSSAQLSSVVGSHDAVAAARRVQLIDHVNGRDELIYSRLRATTRELRTQRRALEAERNEQSDALDSLHAQSTAMDTKLALAQQREQAELAEQARLAAQSIAEDAVTTTTAPPERTAPTTTTTTPPPQVVTPAPPPNYQGTPGVHPRHDDPFLTCVRARESGGNYGAVNPAGPYLGAYQFLQATWNGAANHVGRTDLVGVPANLASQYDQDDVAWALYQWQGPGPWGGGCP